MDYHVTWGREREEKKMGNECLGGGLLQPTEGPIRLQIVFFN